LIEIIVLIFLIYIQSIFGIGLLIIGTPIFLLIYKDFFYTLSILLPLSISVSVLQLVFSREKVEKNFLNNFNFFCISGLVFSLVLVSLYEKIINFNFIISILIIFFSIISITNSKIIFISILKIFSKKTTFLFLGIIHGFSNAGGTLLTLLCSSSFKKKSIIRHHIAFGYLLMGVIQFLFLLVIKKFNLNFDIIFLILIVPLIFYLSKKTYNKINSYFFIKCLNYLALSSGLYLFLNSVIR